MTNNWLGLKIPVEDGYINVAHLPASDSAPTQNPIIVFHGTGMNAWCHRRLIEDYQRVHPIYLVDFRGHGISSSTRNNAIQNWGVFYDDTEATLKFISQRHELTLPHILAHSLGSLVSVEMLNRGYEFASMTLIEPVMLRNWEVLGVRFTQFFDRVFKGHFKSVRQLNPKVRQALRRRRKWNNREAVEASYLKKSFFKAFDTQVLADYLDGGLVETKTGVELACSPEFEAEVFHHLDTYVMTTSTAACPNTTIVLGEKESTTVSKRGRRVLAQRFPDAKIESMPHQGHFMPFNVPEEVKTFIRI